MMRRAMKFVGVIVAASLVAVGVWSVAGAAVPGTQAGMPQTAQVMYAVADSSGRLMRSLGAHSSYRASQGSYYVNFSQSVRGCAAVAGLERQTFFGLALPGEVTATTEEGGLNQVRVDTFNSDGSPADHRFQLILSC